MEGALLDATDSIRFLNLDKGSKRPVQVSYDNMTFPKLATTVEAPATRSVERNIPIRTSAHYLVRSRSLFDAGEAVSVSTSLTSVHASIFTSGHNLSKLVRQHFVPSGSPLLIPGPLVRSAEASGPGASWWTMRRSTGSSWSGSSSGAATRTTGARGCPPGCPPAL